MYERIQPVVLVGGRSTRFGRDKLREPMGDGWLVDRPIAALREVFGKRVALVGECAATVAARGDFVIPDRYQGAGPAGGIASALMWASETRRADAVVVLAGDLPSVTASVVRTLMETRTNDAVVVMAKTDRDEPCAAVYQLAMLPLLASMLTGGKITALHAVIAELTAASVARVPVPMSTLRNVNTVGDLGPGADFG